MSPARISQALALLVLALVAGIGALTSGTDAPAPVSAPVCTVEQVGMFNPCATLDTTQVQDRRPSEADCRAVAHEVGRTQAYTGSPLERACLGEEDDPRVGLALDYGQTEAEYAEAEASER